MKLFENIINMKINNITGKDLMKYARILEIPLTSNQAEAIARYLRGKNINIFRDEDRARAVREIARIAGPETAKKVNRMIIEIMKD